MKTMLFRHAPGLNRIAAAFLAFVFVVAPAAAQQNIAYIDSEFILDQTPEYQTIQQQLDRIAEDWQSELDERRQELDEQFREYQARELLYTNEERQRRRQEIVRAEEELEQLRVQYFGPEGEIFAEQERLMRPLQERILEAVEHVANAEGYDYVFDKSGDFLFMYTRAQYDVSSLVLEELGIDSDNIQQRAGQN